MAKLFILRHGATLGNKGERKGKKEVMRGVSKMGLDQDGRDEAKRAGQFLKGKGIEEIYCSDLPRGKQTAEILARTLGGNIPIHVVKEMRTWNPGVLAGRPLDKVQSAVTYFETHPNVQVPGGEKIGDWLDNKQKKAQDELFSAARKKNVAAIWHSRPILVMLTELEGKDRAKFHENWNKVPAPGSILEGTVGEKGKPKMKLVVGKLQRDKKS